MLSKETLSQAATTYFVQAIKDYLGDRCYESLTKEEATVAVLEAAKQASSEMDAAIIKAELTDHCIHWVADLTLKYEEEEFVIEAPFNRVSAQETHILQPAMFLEALLKGAVGESGHRSMTPAAVLDVSKILEKYICLCPGCMASVFLAEAKFCGDRILFCFRVTFCVKDDEQATIVYEVEWPQR